MMTTRSNVPRLGALIFLSRWLQAPLYLGLIIAQAAYVWQFMLELWHLVSKVGHLREAEIMLIVLGLVDVVMIANLLIMVIVGGYETFVSRIRLSDHPDQPEWLSHVNANVLQGEAGDGDHRDLLDPPAENLHPGADAVRHDNSRRCNHPVADADTSRLH